MTTNFNAFVIYGTTFLQIALAVIYTDQWAVHLEGGPMVADEVADKHGFVNLGMIVKDYYHFQHRKVAKRSIETNDEHHSKLVNEPSVRWAEQQTLKRRVKRDLLSSSSNVMEMNDPEWSKMWYLNRGNGLDMNVQAAWVQGVTGKGVVVTILDDGLEYDHPDIKGNYDPLASYDVNNHDDDPQPRYDFIDSNRHGTRCAGEVAADANNSICAVGVAYEAEIGGVRMLDGDVTDAVEARSLSLNPQHIDIYSASWGPDDNGKTVDGPGELATRAFLEGIQHGRRGLGSIFVWASGNGGKDRDNCNCDGYTNSIWTLSISSATEFGLVPWYSEACSSTLATTYSSGSVGERQVVTTDLRSTCTLMHTGTSASAPLAAGICALALQVNPTLTWRDMQHIVVHTAKPANLRTSDWQTNGVGRNVSHSFGYGLMDAAAMVELARNWTTVPPQKVCEARFQLANKLIPAVSQVTLALKVDCPEINYLEHVQAKISLVGPRRGDIQIYLKSPMGTRSILLDTRPHDDSSAGFHSWPFMTVHNWGESPKGTWILEIHNEGRYEDAKVTDAKLVLYGAKFKNTVEEEEQQHQGQQEKNVMDTSSVAVGDAEMALSAATSSSNVTLCRVTDKSGRCIECISGAVLHDGQCGSQCPEGMFIGTVIAATTLEVLMMNTSLSGLVCRLCHYSCKSCKGPSDSECEECHPDADLTESSSCRPTNLLHEMNGIQNYGFAMTVAVAVLAVVIVVILLYLLCCQNEKKVDGRTYKVLPQKSSSSSSSYFALDMPGLNGSKNTVQTEEFNDDSQEET